MTRASTPRRNRNSELGRFGEAIAAEHLIRRGHRILDRNWRSPHGEIDLVTMDRDAVVVVEVKTRSGVEFGHPIEAIGAAKYERLHRLGWEWCAAHEMAGRLERVDAVAVLLRADGTVSVEHIEGLR
jgi:putative endonuclease